MYTLLLAPLLSLLFLAYPSEQHIHKVIDTDSTRASEYLDLNGFDDDDTEGDITYDRLQTNYCVAKFKLTTGGCESVNSYNTIVDLRNFRIEELESVLPVCNSTHECPSTQEWIDSEVNTFIDDKTFDLKCKKACEDNPDCDMNKIKRARGRKGIDETHKYAPCRPKKTGADPKSSGMSF